MNSFLFLGIFSAHVSLARAGLATCTDADCPKGYFCYENICKKCLRCDLLFRKGNFCVIDFNDCKNCMEGYEELLITDSSNVIKPCKPKKKKIKLKTCENDSSCPLNNYCNEESCVKCFDCSLLNRVTPVEKCAKGLNECGSCMIGFHEVSVTTAANHKPCERDTHIVSEIYSSGEISLVTIAPVIALIVLILTVAVFSKFKQLKDHLSTKTQDDGPVHPSAPPLYSSNTSEYVRKIDGTQPTSVGFVKEKKQQARVFRQPNASYYYIDDEANQLDNAENNGRTTPSSYTPSNSAQPEEINWSSGMLFNEHSELDLNESGMESENENNIDENDSHSINSVALDVINAAQIFSENSSNQEIDSLPVNQNLNQEQI